MHEHDEQHDVGRDDTGWSRWGRPDRPPAEMDRDELLAELQRVRHELTTYRTEVGQQMDQLAENRRELEASRDRYADLYDLAPVGYVTLDPNGLIADINLIGAEGLGVQRKHLFSRPFMGWVVQPDRHALLDHLRRCRIATAEVVSSELWLSPRGREPFYARLISRPMLKGRTRYFRTAIIDQTQRYRAEEAAGQREAELREQTAEAKRRVEQLRALTAQLTQAEQRERRRLAQLLHDHHQQVLVAAKMRAGMLEGADEEARGQLTELLEEAIDSARNLSRDLCPPVLYDRGLVEALHWLARREHEKLGLTMEVEAEPDAEPADPDLQAFLFQSVQELLLNAVKHGGADHARIRMHRRDGVLTISVQDNGAGCEPEQMFRGSEETPGFGLFSIQERLQMMGGSVSARTAPGQGCRLILRLGPEDAAGGEAGEGRAGRSADESGRPGEAPDPTQAAGTEGEGHGEGQKSRPIRVMLVDDHRIVREGLAEILRAEPDIELIAEASDGRDAVEQVEAAQPDAVVMDVSMPRMDGAEATRNILRDHPRIRVIGLSVHERDDLARSMHEAGAVAYLTKGGPSSDLIEALREHGGKAPTG